MSIDYRERPVSELEKFSVKDADKKREVLYDDACKESEVLNVSEPFCTRDVLKVDNIKDLAQRKVLLSKNLFNSSRFRGEARNDPINAVKVFYDTYPGMLYRVVPETAVIAAFLSKTKYIRLRYVDVAFVLNPEGNTNQKVAQRQNFDLYPLNAGQTREFVDYDYYKWKTPNVTYEEDEEDQVYLAKSVSVQANNAVTRQFSIRFYDVDSLARALNYLWRFIAERMSLPSDEDKPCGYDEAEAKQYDVAFQTWSLAIANLTRYVNEFCSQPVFTSTAATLYANRYAYSCVEGDPYVFDNIVRDIAIVNKNVRQPLFRYGSDKSKGPSPKVYLTRPLELFAKGTTYLAYLGDKNDSQKDWEDAQPLATVVTLYAWRFAVDGYFEYSDSSNDDSYARFVPEHFYVTLSSHPRYSRSDYGKVYDADVNNVRIGYPTVFEFGLQYDVQYNAKTKNYDFRNPQIDASEFQERGLRASGLNPLKLRVRYSRQPIYCGLASLFYSSDQDWYLPSSSFAYMSRTADQRPGRSLISSAKPAKTYDVDSDPDEANSTPKYRVKIMMRLFLYLYYNRLANTQASRPYTLGLLLANMTGYDNEADEEHRRVLYDAIMTDNMNYKYRLCLDANAQGTPNDDCSPYPDKDRLTTYSEYYIGSDNAIYVYDYSKKSSEVRESDKPILERTNIVGKPNYLADLDASYFRLVQGGSSAAVAIPKPLPVVANVPNPAPAVVVPVAVSNVEPALPVPSTAKTSVAQNVPSSQLKKEVAKPKPQGFFATSVPPSTNEGPYPSTASAQEIEQWFRSVKGSEIAKFDERTERANKYDVAKVPSIQRVVGTDAFSVRRNVTVDDRIEGCSVKQDVLIFYEDSKGNDRFEGLAVPRLREERWSSKKVLVDLAKGSVRPI